MNYYLEIIWFIVGAAIGVMLLRNFGHLIFFLVPVGLLAVFFMETTKRQLAILRRRWRSLLRRA